MVGPIYLAEIAPAPIRGLCTCFFTGFSYLILVVAYFANYGAQLHLNGTNAQWVSEPLELTKLTRLGNPNEPTLYDRRHYSVPLLLSSRVATILH